MWLPTGGLHTNVADMSVVEIAQLQSTEKYALTSCIHIMGKQNHTQNIKQYSAIMPCQRYHNL